MMLKDSYKPEAKLLQVMPIESTETSLRPDDWVENITQRCPRDVHAHRVFVDRTMQSERAVSYTHLDVYKRQELIIKAIYPFQCYIL